MSWTQIGSDIDGRAANNFFGENLSLSSDGTVIAVRAFPNTNGQVTIFKNVSNTWSQIGSDINGEAAGDYAGSGISISGDGTTVAIGAPTNDGNGTDSGNIRVFKNINDVWTKIGSTIFGEAAGDEAGRVVRLNNDGTVMAVGAAYNDGNGANAGHVRVYKNTNNVWSQIGSDINGNAGGNQFGYSVALNSSGTILATSAYSNSTGGPGTNSGYVKIYQNNNNVWTQIGSTIFGEAVGDNSGGSIDLSSDGTIVAIGAEKNGGNGKTWCGHVRVYKNINNVWTQIGSDIDGEAASDGSGRPVKLSGDGTIVAIGAPGNDGNGNLSGHVRVFKYNGTSWNQLGSDIDGEASFNYFGKSVSISSDGSIVAIGTGSNSGNGYASGHVRVYKYQTPSTPTILSVTVLQTTATINFTQSSNGTAAVTSYKYAFSTTGSTGTYGSYVTSNWTSGTSFTVTNLTIGTTYYFKIIANNGGDSSESSVSSAVTVTNFAPNSPTISSITVLQTTATINFTVGTANGSNAVTSYKYAFSTTGATGTYGSYLTSTNWASGTSFDVSDLTPGSTYYFKIIANNGIDSSESSVSSAVTVTNFAPNSPTISSVTVSQTTATINFTAGTANGSNAVTSYKYAFSTNGTTYSLYLPSNWTTGTNFTVSGLTVGTTYYFKIIANNGIDSIASTASSATTVSNFAPDAPTISSITLSQTTATINFTPGSSNGSNAVTSYKYAFSTTGATGTYGSYLTSTNWITGTTRFDVSGLTPGSTYYFKIIANNGIDSSASTVSSALSIPDTPPLSPTISSVTLSQNIATINFTQSSNSSNAVTSYKYAFSTTGATGTYGSYLPSNWTTGTSFTVSGLTVGSTYYFKIIANNGIDSIESNTSSAVIVVNFAPNSPTILNATGSNTTATIIFTPGSANGSNSITNYAYSTDSVITQNSVFTLLSVNSNGTYQNTSPITINGLTNGETYSFTLKAFNGLYSSASTTVSNVLVSLPKPPPTITFISGRDKTATIEFTQATNVSAPITGYAYSMDATITDNSIFTLISRTTSPITITGLTNGQQYSFTLKSFNGSYSRASRTMTTTIYGNSPAPVILEASGSNGTAEFIFTKPQTNFPIQNYLYSTDNITFNPLPLKNGITQLSSPFYIYNLEPGNCSFWFKYNDGLLSTPSTVINVNVLFSQPAPVIRSVTGNGVGTATITIEQSTNNSTLIKNYAYNIGSDWILFDPPQTSSPLIIDNLDNASNFNFTLRSFNNYYSTDSNTITNVPINFEKPSKPIISDFYFLNESLIIKTQPSTSNSTIPVKFYAYSTNSLNNLNKDTVFTNLSLLEEEGTITIPNFPIDKRNITIRSFNGRYSDNSNTLFVIKPSVDSATNNIVRIKQTTDDLPIEYSINNGTTWNNIVWPFIVGNKNSATTNLLIKIETKLTLKVLPSEDTNFFIISNNNITIDGNNYEIKIKNFSKFPGLIQNGTLNSNGFNNITITNIKIISSGTTTSLAKEQGWICSKNFGKMSTNNLIENCSSSGNITENSGGICGSYTGINSTNFTINLCISSGNIVDNGSGRDAGGILGSNCGSSSTLFLVNNCTFSGNINGYGSGGIVGSKSSNIKITNCSSSGVIKGGGITGRFTGITTNINSGFVEIVNCFSTGKIGNTVTDALVWGTSVTPNPSINTFSLPGGIVADYACNVKISDCYSYGIIGGDRFISTTQAGGVNVYEYYSCGGIIGGFAGYNSGSINISRCVSYGFISENCGGIAASNFGVSSGRLHVIKLCYSVGNIGNNAGGIAGPNIAPDYDKLPFFDYGEYTEIRDARHRFSITTYNTLLSKFYLPDNTIPFFKIGGVGTKERAPQDYPITVTTPQAFVNIIACCSYGSLTSGNQSSGGIIARTVNKYPITPSNMSTYSLTYLDGGTEIFQYYKTCNYFVLHLYDCKYYGNGSFVGIVFNNTAGYQNNYGGILNYENLSWRGGKSGIQNNNSQIGLNSTVPPIQVDGLIDDILYYGTELTMVIPGNTSLNKRYEAVFNFGGANTGAIIRDRIIYGFYPLINSLPKKITTVEKFLLMGYSVPEIIQNGFTIVDLSTTNLYLHIYNTSFGGNYTISTLLTNGFPMSSFKKLGITFKQIQEDAINNNIIITALNFFNAGATMTELKEIFNYSIQQFIDNNFNPEQIIQGFTVNELINYGWTPRMFRIAKYPLSYLVHYAKYDYLQLEGCNYSIQEIIQSYNNMIQNNSLTFWKQMIEIGYSPRLLLPATEDWPDLDAYNLPSNFTPADIARTKISPQQCLDAGYSRRQVLTFELFGFSASQLRSSGFTLSEYITVRGKGSAAAAAAVAAGYNNTQIQAARIFYTQPPPLFKEIITTPSLTNPLYNDLTIYFTQNTNVSPDIIAYVVSLDDGNTYRFIKPPKKGDPIRLRDITTNKIVSILISSFNGEIGEINDILEMVPLKINTQTQIENALLIILNMPPSPDTIPPPVMKYSNTSVIITDTVNSYNEQIDFSVYSTNSNTNVSDNFLLVFAEVVSQLAKKKEVKKQIINSAATSISKKILMDLATGNYAGLIIYIVASAAKIIISLLAAENAKQLDNTSLTFNKLDNSPTITSVTCINGTITVYFTIMPESGISLNNFSYSIDNSEFLLVSPKTTTSPLVIKNSGVTSGENHNIRIRACDNRTSLYQFAYSESSESFTDKFSNPITIRAYSNPSNSFNFFANFANMAPRIIKMDFVSTQASTVDVSFIQDKLNSADKITNYGWTSDGKTFTLLNPAKTTSPVRITVPSGTTQIALSSFNGFYSRYFSNWVSVSSSNKPATPELSGVYKRRNGQYDLIPGAFTIEFPVKKSTTSVIHYEYTINSGSTYTIYLVKDVQSYTGTTGTFNWLNIQLATTVTSINVAVRAYNGVYSDLSKYKKNA
jgi:hypothetical protein